MKLNNKGYMLIEIILAFVIAMGIAYFMFELIIKIKNKNDDLLVKTLVATDQAIIYNKIMNDLHKNGGDSFNCSNLKLNVKTLYYDKNGNEKTDNGEIIDIISDYSNVEITECEKKYNPDNNEITIKIPLKVKQLSDDYDVEINYPYDPNILWLYKDGEPYESTTGGWSAVSHGRIETNYWSDASITFASSYVELNAATHPSPLVNQFGGAMTGNVIDVTNYSKLYVKVSERSYTSNTSAGEFIYGGLGLYTSRVSGDTARSYLLNLEKVSAGLYYLDISSVVPGSYYVGVEVGCESSTYKELYSRMKFTEVYLKK